MCFGETFELREYPIGFILPSDYSDIDHGQGNTLKRAAKLTRRKVW